MKTMNNVPEKHVFVCVNERTDGRDCCADVHGMDIFMELKKFVISHGLVGRIWVTKTGCLGFCNPSCSITNGHRGDFHPNFVYRFGGCCFFGSWFVIWFRWTRGSKSSYRQDERKHFFTQIKLSNSVSQKAPETELFVLTFV